MAKQPEPTRPKRGSVIRYAYLWASEDRRGQSEGRKDRPSLVIAISIRKESSQIGVLAVAITHTQPKSPEDGISLPAKVKRELGLDTEPAWIITTEANAFTWPGPDIRPVPGRPVSTPFYGEIPEPLLRQITVSYLSNRDRQRSQIVIRTS